jgi:hypothetical protein
MPLQPYTEATKQRSRSALVAGERGVVGFHANVDVASVIANIKTERKSV